MRTASRETPKSPRLYWAIVPEPSCRVIVPTGPKSSVTQSTVPSGRFTFFTCAVMTLKPPQPLNFDSSTVASPLGVWPPSAEPLRVSLSVPPVWHPGGVGVGEPMTVSENVPLAVAPAASVTVTVNVEVPIVVGAPSRSPDGRSTRPAGTFPDHAYGPVPPVARKLVVKKLSTKTLLPAPMSHTLPLHVKN